MQNNTQTYEQQTLQFGEAVSMFSQADSLANHSVKPENGKVQMMNATCGRKCLEQFARFSHVGLWARTFSELLIGMTDWYSNRCALTWKLKATKCNRLYFQLVVSTPRINDTGHGLLLTPTAVQTCEEPEKMRDRAQKNGYRNGTKFGSLTSQVIFGGMLPTPEASNYKHGHRTVSPRIERKLDQGWTIGLNDRATLGLLPTPKVHDSQGGIQKVTGKTITRPSGQTFSVGLRDLAGNNMLPTPSTRDWKGISIAESKRQRSQTTTFGKSLPDVISQNGKTSQLNPLFVAEMMGFPTDWTVLPFQDGGKKASKPMEMP